MSKIVQLKKEGINEYPITIPEAVIDSDGITVKDKIKSLEDTIKNIQPSGGSYDDSKLKEDIAILQQNKAEKSKIPTKLSQLEQDIEISAVTPDWNAREGEAGYIKNKPFYNNVDYVINKGGEYKNVHNESNVTFNNKILFNLGDIVDNDVITINSGPPVTLEKRYESDGTTTLIIEDVSNYLSTYPIIIGDLVTIPEIFIPDTIARKSDLENLPNGSTSKSQFQIYKENGGSFYETEEQYNLYTVLRNDPGKITTFIYGPLTSGNYTWSDYGINSKMVAKWIYYNSYWKNLDEPFYIDVIDPDLDDLEVQTTDIGFDNGVIVLNYSEGIIRIYLNGSVNVELDL